MEGETKREEPRETLPKHHDIEWLSIYIIIISFQTAINILVILWV